VWVILCDIIYFFKLIYKSLIINELQGKKSLNYSCAWAYGVIKEAKLRLMAKVKGPCMIGYRKGKRPYIASMNVATKSQ